MTIIDRPLKITKKDKILMIITLLLYLFVIWFKIIMGFSFVLVSGPSMEPTLKNGDILLVQQIKKADWSEGDIVSVKHDGTYIIKRVTDIMDNKAYILGDNSDVSFDSRYFGYIPIEEIEYKMISKLFHIYYIFN